MKKTEVILMLVTTAIIIVGALAGGSVNNVNIDLYEGDIINE